MDITIAGIIANDEKLYPGTLVHYLRVLMLQGRNLRNPYHNLRHLLHVLWQCYAACVYYRKELPPRTKRTLLVAAMLHDINHSGKTGSGNDDLEIKQAIRFLRTIVAEADIPYLSEIEELMRWTEYPEKVPAHKLSLSGQILRDADFSQTLDRAWLQQIVFGLGAELGFEPLTMLRLQLQFLEKVRFNTQWGREKFGSLIPAKKDEVSRLLAMLEG